jgi:hypothetical protein
MSTLQSRRSPLDVIRALRAAKQLGGGLRNRAGWREILAEALERRQMLTVTSAAIYPPGSATEGGTTFVYPTASTNHDPAPTNWSIQFGDGGTLYTSIYGSMSIAHTYAEEGTYSVTAQVSDASFGGSYYYCSTTITVHDASLSAADGTYTTTIDPTEGLSYYGTVAHFNDGNPGASASDFSASVLFGDAGSVGASVVADPSGGFDVVADHTFAEEGSYFGSVAIADSGGSSLTMYVESYVGDAPLSPASDGMAYINATEGLSFGGTVAQFTDANPAATASDFNAYIAYGDGTNDSAAVTADGSGFDVVATHTYGEEGSYAGSVIIIDQGGSSLTMSLAANVSDASLSENYAGISATEGISFTGTAAQFTDANPGASASEFAAYVSYGDGSYDTASVVPDGSAFDVVVSHTFAEEGSYGGSVTIIDQGGSSLTLSLASTVADAPLSAASSDGTTYVSATEGLSFSTTAQFTDANPGASASDFSAYISYGDGTYDAVGVTADGNAFDIPINHTFAEEGTYAGSVTIVDEGGSSLALSLASTVVDAPLSAASSDGSTYVIATEGISFTSTVAQFTDANPGAGASDFYAYVSYGDGTNDSASVVADGSGFDVVASHTYAEEGSSYGGTVTVIDEGGSSLTMSLAANVSDAPLSAAGSDGTMYVSATEGVSFTSTVAQFTDANPGAGASDFYAYASYGDGTNDSALVVADGSGFDVVASHTYAEEGSYGGSVTIIDQGGSSLTMSLAANVSDASLSADYSGISATEGISFSGTAAHFYDANSGASASDFSAGISYGDDVSQAATVVADPSGGFDVVVSHTFAEEGSYSGTVSVFDEGGSTLEMSTASTVADAPIYAYDDSGVFATGQSQDVTAVTFTDGNIYETGTDITASINWGDGNTDAGTLVNDGSGNFEVHGTHNYLTSGTFNGTVTITDAGGSSATANYTGTAVAINSITATDNGTGGASVTATDTSAPTLLFTPNYDGSGSIHLSGDISPDTGTADAATQYVLLDATGAQVASGTLSSGGDDVTLPATAAGVMNSYTVEAGTFINGFFNVTQTMLVAAPNRLFVDTTSLTLCCVGDGNTLNPVIIALNNGPRNAPIGVAGANLDITASGGVTVPATVTTDARGAATLVITPTAGDGGELMGGEGTSVITVTDPSPGGQWTNIVVHWVLPTLTISTAALYIRPGDGSTATVSLADPEHGGIAIGGIPLTFSVSNTDPDNPVAVIRTFGDSTGAISSGLPGAVSVFFGVPATASPGDTCTLTVTVTGINGSALSVSCIVHVVTSV